MTRLATPASSARASARAFCSFESVSVSTWHPNVTAAYLMIITKGSKNERQMPILGKGMLAKHAGWEGQAEKYRSNGCFSQHAQKPELGQ